MSESFDLYQIRGELTGINAEVARETVSKMLVAYRTAYDQAWKIVREMREQGYKRSHSRTDAYIGWRQWRSDHRTSPLNREEWYLLFFYARAIQSGETPHIKMADTRIIMPFNNIRFHSDRKIVIKYAGMKLQATSWEGTTDKIWNSISSLPGNLVALDLIQNDRGEYRLELSILVYHALTDNPHEFALWIAEGTQDTPPARKERSWVK